MQNIFELFNELDVNAFFFLLFLLIAIICPGMLIIFIYNSPLYFSLSIIKLILLSISISSPIFIFNFIVNYFIAHQLLNNLSFVIGRVEWQNEGKELLYELSEASIGGSIRNSFFSLYFGILIAYIFSLSIINLIYSVIFLEIIVIVLTFIFEKKSANDLEDYHENKEKL